MTGCAIQLRRGTTAARTCAADEATGPSASRKYNAASASTTGAVTFSARRVELGSTLTNVTDISSTGR